MNPDKEWEIYFAGFREGQKYTREFYWILKRIDEMGKDASKIKNNLNELFSMLIWKI